MASPTSPLIKQIIDFSKSRNRIIKDEDGVLSGGGPVSPAEILNTAAQYEQLAINMLIDGDTPCIKPLPRDLVDNVMAAATWRVYWNPANVKQYDRSCPFAPLYFEDIQQRIKEHNATIKAQEASAASLGSAAAANTPEAAIKNQVLTLAINPHEIQAAPAVPGNDGSTSGARQTRPPSKPYTSNTTIKNPTGAQVSNPPGQINKTQTGRAASGPNINPPNTINRFPVASGASRSDTSGGHPGGARLNQQPCETTYTLSNHGCAYNTDYRTAYIKFERKYTKLINPPPSKFQVRPGVTNRPNSLPEVPNGAAVKLPPHPRALTFEKYPINRFGLPTRESSTGLPPNTVEFTVKNSHSQFVGIGEEYLNRFRSRFPHIKFFYYALSDNEMRLPANRGLKFIIWMTHQKDTKLLPAKAAIRGVISGLKLWQKVWLWEYDKSGVWDIDEFEHHFSPYFQPLGEDGKPTGKFVAAPLPQNPAWQRAASTQRQPSGLQQHQIAGGTGSLNPAPSSLTSNTSAPLIIRPGGSGAAGASPLSTLNESSTPAVKDAENSTALALYGEERPTQGGPAPEPYGWESPQHMPEDLRTWLINQFRLNGIPPVIKDLLKPTEFAFAQKVYKKAIEDFTEYVGNECKSISFQDAIKLGKFQGNINNPLPEKKDGGSGT